MRRRAIACHVGRQDSSKPSLDAFLGQMSGAGGEADVHSGTGTIWSDITLDSDARCKGYWVLNAALAPIAGSVIALLAALTVLPKLILLWKPFG